MCPSVREVQGMKFSIKGRRLSIEPQPIVLAALILGWAIYYYFSTVRRPHGGPESVLFIKPLTIIIAICFVFVVLGAIKVDSPGGRETSTEDRGTDRGFLDHRRIFFSVSLVAYAAALTLFGYLIPSVIFIFVVCYYLWVRKPWILIGVPVGISVLMSVVFKVVMSVPIPIWPSW